MEKNQELRVGLVSKGKSIEDESFRIIEEKTGQTSFSKNEWNIVRRVIHTTGDFDYANIMKFSANALESGVNALLNRATIFTDTRMIAAGLSPWRLEWFGSSIETPIKNPETQRLAEEWGITRSAASFRIISHRLNGSIVAIGNAPTALLEVIRLIDEEAIKPALVIGVPVGFVQAAESKELLASTDKVPYIISQGTKGGSTVAVAILHGLMESARADR